MRLFTLSVATILWLAWVFVAPVSAACADPVSQNDILIHRSLSYLEVDWYFTVAPGCSGSGFQIKVYKDNGSTFDNRDTFHSQSVNLDLEPGNYVLNAAVSTSSPSVAVMYADGKPYRIEAFNPLDY